MARPLGETDNCRYRLTRYCQGQGLDIGCGATKIKPDAIGVDLYNPNVAEMRMDARDLSKYPDGHFDYIYSSHLLEEIENTEETLKGWLRVLKDGGNIVLYQADKDLYYPMGHPNCNPSHKHHFDWETLWAIFQKIGGVDLIHHARDNNKEWSFELVVKKNLSGIKTEIPVNNFKTSFKFMVVGGPAELYIEKCLESIKSQNYPNWTAQVVLDPLDSSYDKALKFQSDKIKIHFNKERKFNIANFLKASELLNPSDDDVMIMVDADDWLSCSDVLLVLQSYYEKDPNLLLTHGSWVSHPEPSPTNNIPYSEHEFKNNIRKFMWRASHLRTCKYKLWKNIKEKDLRNEKGQFFPTAGDLAIMYPMLEMAGFHRVKFIPDILYIYNRETAFSDEKLDHGAQMRTTIQIQSMTPYSYRETF